MNRAVKYGNVLVTGASGFLAGRMSKIFVEMDLFEHLLATSRSDIRSQEFKDRGIDFIGGDCLDVNHCERICRDIDIVVHCAALSSPWGKYIDFYNSNVAITRNLLEAAKTVGVKKFIFISTPGVYFNFHSRLNVSEFNTLPSRPANSYAATKLMAEKLVLENNQPDFGTIALRPRAIIGAEDTVILPRLIRAHEAGKLKIIGSGKNIVDMTNVTNVVEAVICCIESEPEVYGQAYNITNGDPVELWAAINYTLRELGYKEVQKKISRRLAMMAAFVDENLHRYILKNTEPVLTRYGISVLSDNFTLNINKSRKLLGYQPKSDTKAGIDEYINWHKAKKWK